MTASDVLLEAFERIRQEVQAVVAGLSNKQLVWRPTDDANTIAWLVWHLTRVQDDHLAELIGRDQIWVSGGWLDKFNLPFDEAVTGYGQTPDEVGRVRASAELLTGYYDAVHSATIDYVRQLSADELDEVIDANWDPPVTRGVRLVSVLSDDLQHAGQAAYLHGLVTSAL